MNKAFHKIALIGRHGVRNIPQTLLAIADYLQQKKFEVVFESKTAALVNHHDIPEVAADQLQQHAELIIVVGGDGSLINAAHIALTQDLPLLGINRGRLGFLTDVYPDDFATLDAVLAGQYIEESRFLLNSHLKNETQIISTRVALNDVVLLPGDVAHMIEYEIYIDQQHVCNLHADGLIATTPTGSTAYALSGGGPILQPGLNAIGLVPMFPHTLSNRPLVVNADRTIEVVIAKTNQVTPYVSCDGQERKAVEPGQSLMINKCQQELRLIHPKNYSYFETLRTKLGWQK